ncbi:hypothetical protein [Ensifer aridi]|uniref:hypothetical protein n=1 Tax=Ensifer aridi TaxID=1708715 RepID=UPI000428FD6D|nr:hypothetical protein [Ensifer aridi]
MSQMMILGVKGETGLWLVDFGAGTVTPMEGKREDFVAHTDGRTEIIDEVASDADLAVCFEAKESAFSGHFYKTGSAADIAVAFETKEPAFSGHVYRTGSTVDIAVAFETKEPAFSGHMYRTPAE